MRESQRKGQQNPTNPQAAHRKPPEGSEEYSSKLLAKEAENAGSSSGSFIYSTTLIESTEDTSQSSV